MDHPESPSPDGGTVGGLIEEEGASVGDNVWERAANQARRDVERAQERPPGDLGEKPIA
jgi:hypothetical protein